MRHRAADAQSIKRTRAGRGRRANLGAASSVLVLAAVLIAGPAQAGPNLDSAAAQRPNQPAQAGPPRVRLVTDSVTLAVHPYTSCWTARHLGLCYDGMPPRPLPSMGSTQRALTLTFPRDGWRFSVTVTNSKGHRSRVHLVRTSPGSWRLAVKPLRDGRYRADVFGRGPQGDVAAAFAFTLN